MSWDRAFEVVSRALGRMHARDSHAAALELTLEDSIREAIADIDSSDVDPVSSLGTGSPVGVGLEGRTRIGELQRIEQLKTELFGDGINNGVLQDMLTLPPPAFEELG